MSLQVWLPLNGNVNNQGLNSANSTNHGAVVANTGKIGKCYQNTGSTYITIPIDIKINKPFSLCFWYRIDTWSSWGTTITLNAANGDYLGMCPHSNGTQIGTNWYEVRSGTSTCIFDSYHSNTIIVGQWNHISITFDGVNKINTYINGILVSNGTIKTTPLTNFTELTLFKRGTIGVFGYSSLNDVRVYDHCLSAKEVKEISKGLVCHYKLSGPGGYNLLKSTYTGCVGGNGTITANGFSGFSYRYLKYEGTSYSDTISVSGFVTPSASTKYTVSFWAKGACSVICFFYPSMCASGVANTGATTTAADGAINIRLTNEWKRYWITWTTSSSVSGSKNTVLGRIQNQGTGAECYIAGVKFEQGDKATPWCPNTADAEYTTLGYNATTEYDCSGFENNATKTGTINWSGDSRRYSGSYIPANTSSYLSTTLTTGGYANSYTIAYWAKISNMDGKMVFGFGDGNRLNLYPTNSVFCWNTGDGANNPFKNNGTSVSFTSYNGNWHHYAITGNGTTSTLYIDGVRVGDATTYKGITGTKLFISGWDTGTSYKWAGGNISDFRIYATALSADDIKQLYNSPISVSNNGVLFASEFYEG